MFCQQIFHLQIGEASAKTSCAVRPTSVKDFKVSMYCFSHELDEILFEIYEQLLWVSYRFINAALLAVFVVFIV